MRKSAFTMMFAATMATSAVYGIPFAGAVHADGVFELDGNATASPSVAGDDWSTLFPTNTSSSAYSTAFAHDAPPADTTYFTIGSKDVNDVNTWHSAGPGAPDKDELMDAYAATYKTPSNDTTIYFGTDRYAHNGDSTLSIWFLQNKIEVAANNSFVGNHAKNDTLIVSDFTQGGAIGTVRAYRWDPAAPGGPLVQIGSGVDCSAAAANDNMCATINSGSIPSPWAYTPKSGPSGSFPDHSFLEGGFNLTALFPTAPCFTNFLFESRSSQSTTATLKDFVLHSFNNCPIVPPLSAFDLLKVADRDPVDLGDRIGFNITLANGGPDDSFDTNISDPLPPVAGSWSIDGVWQIPSLNVSSGCTITGTAPSQTLSCAFGSLALFEGRAIHVSAPTSVPGDCGLQPNTAFLTTNDNASQSQNSSASVTVLCPDLHITKTAAATSVSAGDSIGFAIVVSNSGPGAAKGVTLNDPLPTGTGISWTDDSSACSIAADTLTCSFGDLASGASASVNISSPTAFASCAQYTNVATASATNHASVNASDSTTVLCPDLNVLKTADAGSVSAGSAIGFTITTSNTGAGSAAGVVLNDPLPTGAGISWSIDSDPSGLCAIAAGTLTCDYGSLASGASQSVHITSPTTFDSCALYTNVATASASNHADVNSSDSTTVLCPALNVVKTADAASVSAGSPIGFTITVSNDGAGTATGVVLSDPLPAGTGIAWSVDLDVTGLCSIAGGVLTCAYGDLGSGASRTVHVTSATTYDSCARYDNTATASASNAPNATGSANTTVLCPDLSVNKTADAASVSAGSAIGFTVTVSNAGPGTATGVVLSDPLPTGAGISWSIDADATGLCSIATDTLACPYGDLGSGDSRSVHVTSPTTFDSCGRYDNTATASATNSPNVTGSDHTTVLCPDLHIVKAADAASVSAGSPIGFTINVSNAGPGVATSVSLDDLLPTGAGISWSIASDTSGACSITSDDLACSFGDLASGGWELVHVTSPTTFDSCGVYTNVATASATNHADVNSTASTTVLCPELHVVKTADAASVSAGSAIGFTINVSNAGAGAATGVSLNDPLPTGSGISWSVASDPSGTCSIANATLACSFGDLASGAWRLVHVTSPTAFASCAAYPNVATASATNHPDVNGTASTTVLCPSLSILKTADAASVVAGGTIGFTITVANGGPGTATGVSLNDPLPTGSGISWSVASDPSGTCSIANATLACSFGDLASGGSRSVHVTSPTAGAACVAYPNTATASATNHASVNASATTTVTCPAGVATRTLGFWATHTAYTEGVFSGNMSGHMTVGTGGHVRTIDSYGKLFGGFYASIPYKSDGHKRQAVDSARMALLQQLIAAKLNCAAFGCSASTMSLIAAADAAYAGNNRGTMATYTGLLDTYNQSGDGVNVDGTGSATPGLSQATATIPFWDNP